ncbi:hypothetical protein HZB07_06810, partial [Candidatus Saganbacteria bacterium]|nr:hypothetical protein [Candidatus Saganbacteria bacterium]
KMAEDNTKLFIDKIEKLIVDGNKEVVGYIDKKVEQTKNEILSEVGKKFSEVNKKMDGLEQSFKKEIKQTYDFLSYDIGEVEKGISRVETKLDAHIKLPMHAV